MWISISTEETDKRAEVTQNSSELTCAFPIHFTAAKQFSVISKSFLSRFYLFISSSGCLVLQQNPSPAVYRIKFVLMWSVWSGSSWTLALTASTHIKYVNPTLLINTVSTIQRMPVLSFKNLKRVNNWQTLVLCLLRNKHYYHYLFARSKDSCADYGISHVIWDFWINNGIISI